MTRTIAQPSAKNRARFVGAYYLLTILIGVFVLFFHGKLALTADLIATAFYIAITILFYDLSRPANRRTTR
jgi:hypothetical protein